MSKEIEYTRFPEFEENPFKYLASVGFTPGEFAAFCVKKATVTGLVSRQSVNLICDGINYENVPVWIHTDVGARSAVIAGVEEIDPSAYFRDAALLFPLPEGTEIVIDDILSEYSVSPECYVIIHTVRGNKYAIAVCGIISSVLKIDELRDTEAPYEPFPTYKPIVKFTFTLDHTPGSLDPTEPKQVVILYDLLEDEILQIPTQNLENPGKFYFPLVDAIATSDDEDLWKISIGIEDGHLIKQAFNGGATLLTYGDSGWTFDWEAGGCVGVWPGCNDADNVPATPGWTTHFDGNNRDASGACGGGEFTREYNAWSIWGDFGPAGPVQDGLFPDFYPIYTGLPQDLYLYEITTDVENIPVLFHHNTDFGRFVDTSIPGEFGVRYIFSRDSMLGIDDALHTSTSGRITFPNTANVTRIHSAERLTQVASWAKNTSPSLSLFDTISMSIVDRTFSESVTLNYGDTSISQNNVMTCHHYSHDLVLYTLRLSDTLWLRTGLSETDTIIINRYILFCIEETNFIAKLFLHSPVTFGFKTNSVYETTNAPAGENTVLQQTSEVTEMELDNTQLAVMGNEAIVKTTSIATKIAEVIDGLNLPFNKIYRCKSEFYIVPTILRKMEN